MNVKLLAKIAFNKIRDEGPVTAFRKAVKYLTLKADHDRFDEGLGTDTTTIVPLWNLSIPSPNARFGVHYQPSSELELTDAARFLGEDLTQFTFVDLGCGKGRMLIVASRLGFKRIVGVEFSPELAKIARANLQKLQIRNAMVDEADAATWVFPDGPLVAYMYNPFGEEVMKGVLEGLRRIRDHAVYVIYSEPKCAALLEASGFLVSLGALPVHPHIRIWRTEAGKLLAG